MHVNRTYQSGHKVERNQGGEGLVSIAERGARSESDPLGATVSLTCGISDRHVLSSSVEASSISIETATSMDLSTESWD